MIDKIQPNDKKERSRAAKEKQKILTIITFYK